MIKSRPLARASGTGPGTMDLRELDAGAGCDSDLASCWAAVPTLVLETTFCSRGATWITEGTTSLATGVGMSCVDTFGVVLESGPPSPEQPYEKSVTARRSVAILVGFPLPISNGPLDV